MVDISKILPVIACATGLLMAFPAKANPKAEDLAAHLKRSNVLYYGSWRCPACKAQSRLFGDAASQLPYVECGKPKELPIQAAACQTAKIRAFPTWILPNGERREGVQTLDELRVWTSMPNTP